MRRFFFCAAALLLSVFAASAQEAVKDDAGAWINIQVNGAFGKAYTFARLEHRSNETFSNTECWFAVAGGGYSLTKWLKADANYEFWHLGEGNIRHKAVVSTTGSINRSGLSAQVREKLELAYNPANGQWAPTLRSRLRTQYAIPNSAFRPYCMAEIFNWDSWQRSLYYAGTEITLNKSLFLDVFYLYHLPAIGRPVHTLGFGLYINI